MRASFVFAALVVCGGCASEITDGPAGGSSTDGAAGPGGSGSSGGMAASGGAGGAAGSCSDSISNGDETGVDCGGSCPPCTSGGPCAANTDCSTGFCAVEDGVCCDSACDGACEACVLAKTTVADGTCAPIQAGEDPDNECPVTPATGCDSSGLGCNGSGSCVLYGASTICASPDCSNGVAMSASLCSGAGDCLPGMQTDCGNFICDATACKTTCTSSADCVAPAICNNGTCNSSVTFDTNNFAGMTAYPLDTDVCGCCGATTTAETAQAFCILAGMTTAISWTTGMINGTNCYCYDCISVDSWASNCCSGQADRPMILTVTCE